MLQNGGGVPLVKVCPGDCMQRCDLALWEMHSRDIVQK